MCIPCASSCSFFCRLLCTLSFSGVFVVLSNSHSAVDELKCEEENSV